MSLRDPPAFARGSGVQPAASQTIGLLKDRFHPMALQKTVGLPFCTALAAVRRATRMLRVNNVPDVFVFFGIRQKSLRDRRSAVQNRSKAVLCFLHPCRKLLRNQPAPVHKTVGLPFCTALAAVRRATWMLRVKTLQAIFCILQPCKMPFRKQPALEAQMFNRNFVQLLSVLLLSSGSLTLVADLCPE